MVAEILYNENARPHQLVLTRDERYRISRTGVDLFGLLASDPLQPLTRLVDDDAAMVLGIGGGESFFEELEFSSQVLQPESARLGHPQPEGCEGEEEEEFLPTPAKRRRLGYFPSMVGSLPESHPVLLDSGETLHTVLPPAAEPTSPGRAETLDNVHFPQLPLAPQNAHVPPDTTLQSRDPVRLDLSDTARRAVPPAAGRADKFGHAPTTGSRRDFAEFLAIRGVRLNVPPAAATTETAINNPQPVEAPQVLQPPLTVIPLNLIDKNTIQLQIGRASCRERVSPYV